LLAAREGHFKLESGHHGSVWLDLDSLFLRPNALQRFAVELANRLSPHKVEAVCGPLTGGAFLAELVASQLDVQFYYTERIQDPQGDALYSAQYKLPKALREKIRGMAVAIVDDAIHAGSAVRSTIADVEACRARPVALGALLVLGPFISDYAADRRMPLEYIGRLPGAFWIPSACPLCASGIPLEHVPTSGR